MNHPEQGGSYRREKDKSLTRVAFTDAAKRETQPAAPDLTATEVPTVTELPSATEAKPLDDASGKKGKA